nr:recombinase family protein [Leucobacter salsicius]
MRAATYRRVSTESQKDNTSLADQQQKTRGEAEHRGWEIVAEYADEGVSGMDDTRPGWREMLSDARSGKFDVLIVLNTKRFARKSWHAIREMEKLMELGVSLISLQESFDLSTPAGRAMFGMSAVFANLDRDSIVENTVSGQRALAREGKLPGGEPPYGWKRLRKSKGEGDGSVIPNEEERGTLRLGYELLVGRRMSCYQVVNHFNDAGIRPRWAKQWNAESIRNIWRNPTLATGKLIWGAPKGQGGSRQRHSKTRLDLQGNPVWGDPVEIDLGNPVFTQAEHSALLRALSRRPTGKAPNAPKTRMLSGRVFTAEGHHMYSVNTPREEWLGYYRCTKRRQSAGADRCKCPQLRASPLEQLVWDEVMYLLSNPVRLQAAARAYLSLPDDDSDREVDRSALEGVRLHIAKLERALGRAERGVLMAETHADEKRQHALRADLRTELTAAHHRLSGYEALASSEEARSRASEDVAALAERARGRLHKMNEEERAEVVTILQLSVVTSAPVVAGMPETVAISGIVDPQLWANEPGLDQTRERSSPVESLAQSAEEAGPSVDHRGEKTAAQTKSAVGLRADIQKQLGGSSTLLSFAPPKDLLPISKGTTSLPPFAWTIGG